ncbi:4917_t:CDS:2 [Paraglomus occultum]|uniref:4917_t:CDS:1 n=1 Tax=Paraglomus occultum TaxID=144539 RepID=A0A9N9ADX3_9GLOM|nr:4917_t:CDS:2 [Paraglomus occultum]
MAKSQRLILCLIVAVLALFIGTNAIPIVRDVTNPIGVNAPSTSTSTPAPAKPTPTSSKSATASPTQKPSPTPTTSSDSSSDSNTDSNSDSSPTSSPSEDNSAAATATPPSTGLPGTQLKTSTGPIVAASVVSSLNDLQRTILQAKIEPCNSGFPQVAATLIGAARS